LLPLGNKVVRDYVYAVYNMSVEEARKFIESLPSRAALSKTDRRYLETIMRALDRLEKAVEMGRLAQLAKEAIEALMRGEGRSIELARKAADIGLPIEIVRFGRSGVAITRRSIGEDDELLRSPAILVLMAARTNGVAKIENIEVAESGVVARIRVGEEVVEVSARAGDKVAMAALNDIVATLKSEEVRNRLASDIGSVLAKALESAARELASVVEAPPDAARIEMKRDDLLNKVVASIEVSGARGKVSARIEARVASHGHRAVPKRINRGARQSVLHLVAPAQHPLGAHHRDEQGR